MNWYLKALKNYAGFKGRARRKEYWTFTLVNTFFIVLLILINNTIGVTNGVILKIPILLLLVLLVPSLAVSFRRLHDIGKSGLNCLIIIIPVVGAIWLIILCCHDSLPGTNGYGENPKGNTDSMKKGVDFEKEAGIGWLISGYIFAILGGILGILIGHYLKSGILMPDQSTEDLFEENSRTHGALIKGIGIVLFIISFLFYLYLLGSN